jgi:HEAT repeat protein
MLTQYKRTWVLLTSLAACAGLATTPAFAGDQVEIQPAENAQVVFLIKLLKGSSQFRVRAQAAISLGMMEKSFAARGALTDALQDPHPAVRAAAATSLGRIGDANQLSALRVLARDPEQPVRNAARASIGRLEDAPVLLDTVTTTAARSTTASTHHL